MRRTSIAGLMVAVLCCGVGVAALKRATEAWAAGVLTGTLLILGIALLGALQRRDAARAWWQGFALFGWGYLLLTFGPWTRDAIGPSLATTDWLDTAFTRLHPRPDQRLLSVLMIARLQDQLDEKLADTTEEQKWRRIYLDMTGTLPTPNDLELIRSSRRPSTTSRPPTMPADRDVFRRIGHALFALVAGLVGGLISRGMFVGRSRATN